MDPFPDAAAATPAEGRSLDPADRARGAEVGDAFPTACPVDPFADAVAAAPVEGTSLDPADRSRGAEVGVAFSTACPEDPFSVSVGATPVRAVPRFPPGAGTSLHARRPAEHSGAAGARPPHGHESSRSVPLFPYDGTGRGERGAGEPSARARSVPSGAAGSPPSRRPFGEKCPPLSGYASLFRAIVRALRTSPTALGMFLRGWSQREARECCSAKRSAPRVGLFPCAAWRGLPPLDLGEDPLSRAAASVDAETGSAADALAELLFGVSSFVACGCRKEVPACPAPKSASHRAVLRSVRLRLRAFAWRGGLLGVSPEGAPRTGRKGPAIDAALRRVRETVSFSVPEEACASHLYSVPEVGWVKDLEKTPVRPLVADRLSFPERAATFRLADFLHGDTRAAFLHPRRLRREGAPAAPRCAPVRARGGEWEKYLHNVDRANGMDLLVDADVPRDSEGNACIAGFFAIQKDEGRDRTITNRIPQNSQEMQLGLSGQLLAHGCCFVDMDLSTGISLFDLVARVSLRDLPDCFHSVMVSLERAWTNAVGPKVPVEDFRSTPGRAYRRLVARCANLGIAVPKQAQPAWRTLPMGDLNAVCFMQTGHLNLLRRGGALPDSELVRYCAPLPFHGAGSVLTGVVVDDLGVVGIGSRSDVSEPDGSGDAADSRRVAAAMDAYADAGLFPKATKSIDRALVHDLWGATLDGDVGAVSASMALLVRTAIFLLGLVLDGRATCGTLRAVLGLAVYACMFRRPAFAFMSSVFHVVLAWESEDDDRRPAGRRGRAGPAAVRPLPMPARVELELLLAFLPLLTTNLRAPPGERLWATDASSRSAAAVFTHVHPDCVRQMWRHRARRGAKSGDDMLLTLAEQLGRRFAQEAERGDDVAVDVVAQARLLLGTDSCGPDGLFDADARNPAEQPPTWTAAVAEACGWNPSFRYSCPSGEHINVKEARPLRTLLRHLANDPSEMGKRHFALVDSSVNIGAWAKGRSRSTALNHTLVSCVPEQLMADIYLGLGHVRSAYNPADEPTRGRPVRRAPAGEPSAGIAALLRGERSELVFGPESRPVPSALETCAPAP